MKFRLQSTWLSFLTFLLVSGVYSGQVCENAISTTQIRKAIEDFLADRLSCSMEEVVVEVGHLPQQTSVPAGPVAFEVHQANSEREVRGKTLFFVTVFVNGSKKAKIPIVVNVRFFKNVLVTKHRLNRHTQLSVEDLVKERREITGLRASPATEMAEVLGKRTVRVVSAGQILCSDDIEVPPSVAKGDILTVILRLKNLTVSLRGRALGEGWVGDKIWVRALEGRQKYLAQIHGSGLAVIKL